MRWRNKVDVVAGSKRRVQKFLWFPKHLPVLGTDQYENRWLEYAEIEQEYGIWCYEGAEFCWFDKAFIN